MNGRYRLNDLHNLNLVFCALNVPQALRFYFWIFYSFVWFKMYLSQCNSLLTLYCFRHISLSFYLNGMLKYSFSRILSLYFAFNIFVIHCRGIWFLYYVFHFLSSIVAIKFIPSHQSTEVPPQHVFRSLTDRGAKGGILNIM